MPSAFSLQDCTVMVHTCANCGEEGHVWPWKCREEGAGICQQCAHKCTPLATVMYWPARNATLIKRAFDACECMTAVT